MSELLRLEGVVSGLVWSGLVWSGLLWSVPLEDAGSAFRDAIEEFQGAHRRYGGATVTKRPSQRQTAP